MTTTQHLTQTLDRALTRAADSLTLAQTIREALVRAATPESPWRKN